MSKGSDDNRTPNYKKRRECKVWDNMTKKSEDRIQIEFMNWCRWMAKFHDDRFKWFHHIPNGGLRNKREAGTFKLMGVKPGISDCFWPVSVDRMPGWWSGLYIEFKDDKGRPSKEQIEFIEFAKTQGYKVSICRSAEEAIQVVEEYLDEELPRKKVDNGNQ